MGAAALGTVTLGWATGCADGDAEEASGASPGAAADTTDALLSEVGQSALASLGIQLYTVRSVMDGDVAPVLQQIADIGYATVETAGFYGLEPQALRERFEAAGLQTPSGHYPLQQLRDDLDGLAGMAQALGQSYVVCPYLTEDQRGDMDTYRALADEFNAFGRRLAEHDLQFAYHNHDFEFETFGGDTPAYDVLIENTDPELVNFEMDLYWVYKADRDPLDYFERYPGRFPLFHLKDGTAAPEKAMVDVGAGAIDFAGILARADQAGLQYAFVEHDNPEGDPIASIRNSFQHLDAMAS